MPRTKQLADLITWSRAFLAPLFVWLGFSKGQEALPVVVVLMIANWTGDSVDGVLARRSPVPVHTWIGDHDLEVDMVIACGLLAHMTAAGLVAWQVAGLYLLLWLILFLSLGLARALGMLFQAPIYGWFILVVVRDAAPYALLMVGWILAAVLITWPRFPKVIVPGFLAGVRDSLREFRRRGNRP